MTNSTISHYTAQAGLLGIVKSAEIHATKIQYFNDGAELRYGLALVTEQLRSLGDKATSDRERAVSQALLDHISLAMDVNVFVASFSRDGDLLSQWRAYCSYGDGFSLGISLEMLEQLARNRGWAVSNCIYDGREQHRAVTDSLARVLSELPQHPTEFDYGNAFTRHLLPVVLTIKNHTFQDEREVRLVSPLLTETTGQFKFKAGRHSLRPYVRFGLCIDEDFALRKVVVGPTSLLEESVAATAAFLRKARCARPVRPTFSSVRVW
jgi:Protein of unknown function (DUF2971)